VKFFEHTGFSEAELKASKREELLRFGESWFSLSSETGAQKLENIAGALKRVFCADPAPGYVVRSRDKIGCVILDVFDSTTARFEDGQVVGRED
jgi:hypothetical protein